MQTHKLKAIEPVFYEYPRETEFVIVCVCGHRTLPRKKLYDIAAHQEHRIDELYKHIEIHLTKDHKD